MWCIQRERNARSIGEKKDHFRFEITILHIFVIMSIQKNIKINKNKNSARMDGRVRINFIDIYWI